MKDKTQPNDSEELHVRSLVFIGAPRAGKTCLMAGWYEYLKKAENLSNLRASEIAVEGDAKIAEVWESIASRGRGPDQTPVGLPNANRVAFTYCEREYAFDFHDYSGETATKAFTGELKDAELENEVIKTCRNADKLFLVINLEDYLSENSNPLKEVLVFLNQVTQRQDFKLLFEHGVTVYLSHPEKLSKAQLRTCIQDIQRKITKTLPSFPRSAIIAAAIVTDKDSKQVEFTVGNHPFSPKRHLDAVFADLVVIGDSSSKDFLTILSDFCWKTKKRRLISVAAIIIAILSGVAINSYSQTQKENAWEAHRGVFEEYATDKELASSEVPQRIQQINAWKSVAHEDFNRFYLRDEYDTRAASLLADLNQSLVVEKQGVEAIRSLLEKSYKTHGENYRRLYPEITSTVESALANPSRWSTEALNEWRSVKRFIEGMQTGVLIELRQPSFWFEENWNLQLEFHVYDHTHSTPYGSGGATPTEALQGGIQFPLNKNPIKGRDERRFVWNSEAKTGKLFFYERDRIDLRVSEKQWRPDRQILAHRIEPSGIHFFGQLDNEFIVESEHGTFKFNLVNYRLHDANNNEIVIPRLIREASQ